MCGYPNPEFKVPWNRLRNTSCVFTPEYITIQTPNADTPYSMLGYDLRTEPLVLTVSPIEEGRYISLRFIDAYTHNFDYVGSRAPWPGARPTLAAETSCSPDRMDG